VFPWLRAHAILIVKCLPAFVGASDIISSVNFLPIVSPAQVHVPPVRQGPAHGGQPEPHGPDVGCREGATRDALHLRPRRP